MTRYRARAVLPLFGVLHLTACSTTSWQPVSLNAISPAQFIEEDRPDRVRVLMRGGTELELERQAVDGDELVAPGNFSMPLADVLVLEVYRLSVERTIFTGAGGAAAALVALCWPDDASPPRGFSSAGE